MTCNNVLKIINMSFISASQPARSIDTSWQLTRHDGMFSSVIIIFLRCLFLLFSEM